MEAETERTPGVGSYRILGVSLVGPPPVGVVHIPWNVGLNVFYGLNGAGKSTILRGLTAVLEGRGLPDGDGYLHIELLPGAADVASESGPFVRMLGNAMLELLRNRDSVSREDVRRLAESPLEEIVRVLIEHPARVQSSFRPAAADIAEQGRFTLSAAGTDEPRYYLDASGRPSEDTPTLNRVLGELGEELAYLDEDETGLWGSWLTHSIGPFLDEDRPDWVPVPSVYLGEVKESVASVFVGDVGDADDATHRLLVSRGRTSGLASSHS